MTPTKILIGQILVVFAIIIAGVWAATQWAAAMLGYQAQLGAPWFLLFGLPVYRPWQLFPWWYAFDAYAPDVFDRAGMLAAGSGFMGCAAAIIGSLWRARQNRRATPTAPRAGRRGGRSGPPGCSVPQAFSLVVSATAICAMTGRSMSWPMRRPGPARASGWWCRPC